MSRPKRRLAARPTGSDHESGRCPRRPENLAKAAPGDRRFLQCTCAFDRGQDEHVAMARMLRGAPWPAADPSTMEEDVRRAQRQILERDDDDLLELAFGVRVRDGYRHTFS